MPIRLLRRPGWAFQLLVARVWPHVQQLLWSAYHCTVSVMHVSTDPPRRPGSERRLAGRWHVRARRAREPNQLKWGHHMCGVRGWQISTSGRHIHELPRLRRRPLCRRRLAIVRCLPTRQMAERIVCRARRDALRGCAVHSGNFRRAGTGRRYRLRALSRRKVCGIGWFGGMSADDAVPRKRVGSCGAKQCSGPTLHPHDYL